MSMDGSPIIDRQAFRLCYHAGCATGSKATPDRAGASAHLLARDGCIPPRGLPMTLSRRAIRSTKRARAPSQPPLEDGRCDTMPLCGHETRTSLLSSHASAIRPEGDDAGFAAMSICATIGWPAPHWYTLRVSQLDVVDVTAQPRHLADPAKGEGR